MVEENLSEEATSSVTDQTTEIVDFDHKSKPVNESEFIKSANRLADQLLDILG